MSHPLQIHISDFCSERSQQAAADVIGCSQSAVNQMLKAEREIYFTPQGGTFDWYEIKRPKPAPVKR